jgi:hypothetical protein
MKTVTRRKVHVSVEALLQNPLNVDQIERVESVHSLRLDKHVDIAVVARQAASGRSKEVERADSMRSNLR